jgi:hypothetical protein
VTTSLIVGQTYPALPLRTADGWGIILRPRRRASRLPHHDSLERRPPHPRNPQSLAVWVGDPAHRCPRVRLVAAGGRHRAPNPTVGATRFGSDAVQTRRSPGDERRDGSAENVNSVELIGIVLIHYLGASATARKGASAELQASTSPSNASSAWI